VRLLIAFALGAVAIVVSLLTTDPLLVSAVGHGPGLAPALALAQNIRPGSCHPVVEGWILQRFEAAESLFELSIVTGATVESLRQANCLSTDSLFMPDWVLVPVTPPDRQPCGRPFSWSPYIVQPGDTLYSLAQARQTTIYSILQANCLVSTTLYYGRTIYLPPMDN